MRFRLTVAYDGTDYAGWQLQPGRETVQKQVETALARLFHPDGDRSADGRPITTVAAGRTDAGVHAEGQVVHFDAPHAIPVEGVRAAANALLPDAIRIRRAERAASDFHARKDARRKTYRYHILSGPDPSPLRSRFACPERFPLDVGAMTEAASAFVGSHDFRAFFPQPRRGARRDPMLAVSAARLFANDGELIFEVSAPGFRQYMVRRMVGALLLVGRGRTTPGDVRAALARPDADGLRLRAPARGLRLCRVDYGEADSPEADSGTADGVPDAGADAAPETGVPGC